MSIPLKIGFFSGYRPGQSSLVIRLFKNIFIEEYDPCLEDCFKISRKIGVNNYELELYDYVEGEDL